MNSTLARQDVLCLLATQKTTSRLHSANGHNDNQYHSAGRCSYQSTYLANFGPPKFCFFAFQQWIIAWCVDVLHPVLQIIGVEWLLGLLGDKDTEWVVLTGTNCLYGADFYIIEGPVVTRSLGKTNRAPVCSSKRQYSILPV